MLKVSLDRIFIILVHLSATSALLCLSCKHVYDVRDCFTLEECGAHQKCYSNHVVDSLGRSTYTLGCIDQYACNSYLEGGVGRRDANLTQSGATASDLDQKRSASNTCLQCCNDVDGCNRKLCGTTTSNNLRCMTCRDAVETKHCNKFKECGRDQFCFVNRAMNPISSERLYEMDCMGYQQCNGLNNSSPQDCAICCNSTDYCNYAACDTWREKPTVHITKTPVIKNLAMQCKVTGYPIPTIVWDFTSSSAGGHGIPSGVEFSDKPLESTMFVKTYIPADHNGLWTCKASNPLGNALDQVHVP